LAPADVRQALRKIIYTINAIESLTYQLGEDHQEPRSLPQRCGADQAVAHQ
jgi:hypothetical protein